MRFSNPETNILQFKLERGMFVADFGSGSGNYVIPLSKAVGRRGIVYAVDTQQELLSRIKNIANKEGLENVEVVWGDIETSGGSGLKDKTIDAVVVSNTFFLVEDKYNFVKEISRVLKRNGKVLVVDWKDSFNGLGPKKESIIPLHEVKDIFEEHDFILHHEIHVGSYHYGAVFKRKG